MESRPETPRPATPAASEPPGGANGLPACPACGGRLTEVRARVVCSRRRTIDETCCEGGRG